MKRAHSRLADYRYSASYFVDTAMILLWSSTVALLSVVHAVFAVLPDGRVNANVPPRPLAPPLAANETTVQGFNGQNLPPLDTVYYFNQLIDHTNPSLGTFQQRYLASWQYYRPGNLFRQYLELCC